MNRFFVGDYRVAFQIDQNIVSLADIRQTTQRQPSAPSVIRRSPPRQNCLRRPIAPPGEWPTSTNERYRLQKLSLFRVAAFFIADVWNGLILGCSSEFESSVCSQVP